MKVLLLLLGHLCAETVLILPKGVERIQGELTQNSFEEAKKNTQNQIKFTVESTKVGLFSSDVDGFAKKINYTYHIEKSTGIVTNMRIRVNVESMDTDEEDRDQKLREYCLDYKKHPEIVINIPGPINLKAGVYFDQEAKLNVRGKLKKAQVKLKLGRKDGLLSVAAKSQWSLKEMEIPDPSIAVATLSDWIKIQVNLLLKAPKV